MSLLNEFSIQLYSIREQTAQDFPGSLKRLSEIGYTGVEFAGYGNLPADEMRRLLDGFGLKSVGTHAPLERLSANLDEELEYNHTLGTEYIIVPYSPIKSKDDTLRLAESMNDIGGKCLAAGFKFGYHNHDHEFLLDDAGGLCLLDILFDNLNSKFIMELDVFWAAAAKTDYPAYMKKHKDKLRLLHIKQIECLDSKKCVDLDQGIIDYNEIIALGKELGVEHFILEQEEFPGDPFDSIKRNYDYIMGL